MKRRHAVVGDERFENDVRVKPEVVDAPTHRLERGEGFLVDRDEVAGRRDDADVRKVERSIGGALDKILRQVACEDRLVGDLPDVDYGALCERAPRRGEPALREERTAKGDVEMGESGAMLFVDRDVFKIPVGLADRAHESRKGALESERGGARVGIDFRIEGQREPARRRRVDDARAPDLGLSSRAPFAKPRTAEEGREPQGISVWRDGNNGTVSAVVYAFSVMQDCKR